MEDDIPNTELDFWIDEFIHNERDRRLMKRRLIDGVVFDALAEEFDMSVRQVKNIVYKEEKHLSSIIK